MENTTKQPSFIGSITILYFSLLAGQIMIFTVLWFAVQPVQTPAVLLENMDYIIMSVWLGLLALSFLLGNARIAAAREITEVKDKLMSYRAAQVLRWALTEGPVLMLLVAFFFFRSNWIFLGLAGTSILYFLMFMPSRTRAIRDLDLSSAEEAMLDEDIAIPR